MSIHRLRSEPSALIRFLWIGLAVTALVASLAAHPKWWTWIAPEASLAREISTTMLLATSALAALAWRRSDAAGRLTFAVLAVGFLGLAVDERFAIHERLRDRVLAPRGINLPFVPWAEPGDIVLVVLAIVGLVGLRSVLNALETNSQAWRWFVAGVVLALLAVALDTLPIESYQLRNEIYLQSGEEAIELMAAACFLSAMLTVNDSTRSSNGPAGQAHRPADGRGENSTRPVFR